MESLSAKIGCVSLAITNEEQREENAISIVDNMINTTILLPTSILLHHRIHFRMMRTAKIISV